jgi:hypothetical protein
MQDEQVGQPEETVEPDAEDTAAEPEAAAADDSAAEGASDDEAQAAAPADPPTGGGADEAVLQSPEVPDDANEKISAAQEHINSLNMDEERDAAEQAQKQL